MAPAESVVSVPRRSQRPVGRRFAHPGNHGEWWHAVDLISVGHWRDLLETAQFTTTQAIAGAVTYGLTYSSHSGKKRNGHIRIGEARQVMKTLEAKEPDDWRGMICKYFMEPKPVRQDNGSDVWPINMATRDMYADDLRPASWGIITGIETGWFAHDRAGFLGWTVKGRERFAQSNVGDILPRPTGGAMQLDLF